VVLDIQAIHLGQTFDYYVEEKYSEAAQPGVMVRVRFGGQRVNGIIWKRTDTSETPESSLRFIERVVIDRVLVSESSFVSACISVVMLTERFFRIPISACWRDPRSLLS
jgi:primosomal protein N'